MQTRINASRRALLGKAVLAVALIAAPVAFAQSTGKEYTVVMSNMQYGAIPSGVKVGDTIDLGEGLKVEVVAVNGNDVLSTLAKSFHLVG